MTAAVPKCCAQCFGDQGLERLISEISAEDGKCSYCGDERVKLVAPRELADLFGSLVNIYERNADGRLLVDWLREDWDLFHHPRMESPRAKDLLAEVLDNGEIVRQLFVPSPKYRSDHIFNWERLRTELMHENRYFPSARFDLDRLKDLLGYLRKGEVPTEWHRARLQIAEKPFDLSEMGAPPPRATSHGRANPAGIPYLYLGSTPETAIADIRPHTGEKACVADFTIPPGLKLVNLQNPRRIISPFDFDDEDQLGPLRYDLAFLERLGDELTRPVVPQGAPFDYVPSQYLCEYMKKCGNDGVLYRSSVSSGVNLALFQPGLATPRGLHQYSVLRVSAEIKALTEA